MSNSIHICLCSLFPLLLSPPFLSILFPVPLPLSVQCAASLSPVTAASVTIALSVLGSQVHPVLPSFKAGQVHGVREDGIIFMEPLGCLACLYSQVGEPGMLQAACLSACHMSWPLLPSVAPIVAPAPLYVSHHHPSQQGVPTCLSTRRKQSQQDAITLHNMT